jgi:Spy/CpxP family protein refolding chaperone
VPDKKMPMFQLTKTETKGRNMKNNFLLAAITAAAIPLATVFAENAASPTPAEQTKEENSCCMDMMGMRQGNMMRMGSLLRL